ncbi:conserved hypothetical protein [Prevotella intermedia]|uniref:Uncharacterized protein n=1 Tax=Prevotella intermedia TaxID=28131 RepID=A0A0S3UNP1_PREIN|nr:conserved hypothetical protein [Prevotella intermedia]
MSPKAPFGSMQLLQLSHCPYYKQQRTALVPVLQI